MFDKDKILKRMGDAEGLMENAKAALEGNNPKLAFKILELLESVVVELLEEIEKGRS